jgi:nucleotide-binding universal stress UspA family protein
MYKFKKILFGLDINHLSKEAFDYAIHLADRNGAELHVLYVCPNYHMRSVDVYFPKNAMGEVKERARSEIHELCEKKVMSNIAWSLYVEEGISPYRAMIAKSKELKIDLIVMGEHDNHALDNIFLGSNTEKVVRYAPCSVIVIKDKVE